MLNSRQLDDPIAFKNFSNMQIQTDLPLFTLSTRRSSHLDVSKRELMHLTCPMDYNPHQSFLSAFESANTASHWRGQRAGINNTSSSSSHSNNSNILPCFWPVHPDCSNFSCLTAKCRPNLGKPKAAWSVQSKSCRASMEMWFWQPAGPAGKCCCSTTG